MIQIFQCIQIPDLFDLYDLYELVMLLGGSRTIYVIWDVFPLGGSVLCRSSTTAHNVRLGSRGAGWSVDDDLSVDDLSDV